MRRLFFLIGLLFFISVHPILATNSDYVINDFNSAIELNQDTSLTVKETIKVNFNINKHGIFRIIPVDYTGNNRVIKAKLKVINVFLNGNSVNFETSRLNQSIQLKIGDPNRTITGPQTYEINYQISDVIQRYPDHDEIYWNITGSEWDTEIKKASASIGSPYAPITKVDCYAGTINTKEKLCQTSVIVNDIDKTTDQATFQTTSVLGSGKDFTLVVTLDKNNQLAFPGPIHYLIQKWLYWAGFLLLFTPMTVMLYFWLKKGRDIRFISDNVYTQPDNSKTRLVSPFEREHLPMQYTPIKGLTPAQVGTIIDQKVDIQDVVSEIVELARLGFLKIERINKKAFLHTDTDYQFTKLNKSPDVLRDYQQYLLEKLFDESKDGKTIKLSEIKEKFYTHLANFKNKLYNNMAEEKYFDGNPQTVKLKWTGIFIGICVLCFILLGTYTGMTGNFLPLTLLPFMGPVNLVVVIILILAMPRRTAWGHSLFRQITGLRYFINVGKWREEIAEKNLFLEEILPLAVALGVVTKLASDMKDLALQPPDYLTGFTVATFANDFAKFNTVAASTMTSSPGSKWSGSSSWSGSSGFGGGGSSGGGFGGGGGGSW